ncbi:J domain-containing protein [Hippea jasoniae]|uniref:J domain-containing protein n=1 Tax=Hippea jasoniae TaxID=944479 RepID=UPI00054DE12B|nr:J domain-containing protein [Hippea jasoniae]
MIYDFSFQQRFKKIKLYEIAARKILGVEETDPVWIIRHNYLKLAKQYHPDINPKTSDLFKDINTAYAILTKKDLDIDSVKFYTLSLEDLERFEEEYKMEKDKNNYYENWRKRFF